MVKTGLSARPQPFSARVILRETALPERPRRPDATMVDAGPDLAARLDAAMGHRPLLLRIPRLGPDLEEWLAVALPRVAAIVLGDCRDGGDLARLGTRLGVWEALLDRPDGSTAMLAELAPAALLHPATLATARPRLVGLMWDATALAEACGGEHDGLEDSGPAVTVRTLLVLAGASLALPVYDTASPDAALEQAAAAARRLGFTGKVAAHPGQVAALERAFAPRVPLP